MSRNFENIIAIEKSLLALLLKDSDCNVFYDLYESLRPSDFLDPLCAHIYSSIEQIVIHDRSKMDIAMILSNLKNEDAKRLVRKLFSATSGQSRDPQNALKEILDSSRMRSLLQMTDQVKYDILESDITTSNLIGKLEQKLFDISEHRSDSFILPGDCIDETLSRLKRRMDGEVIGVPSYIPAIDKMTCGFEPGYMVIIAGRPSAGKSLVMLQILIEHAKTGKPVGVFNLDMTNEMMMERILSYMSQIPLHKIRSGNLTKNEIDWLQSIIPQIKNLNILMDSHGTLTPQEFISRSRRMKMKYPELGIVCVDYIQLMKHPGAGSRNDEVAYISSVIKSTAKDLNIPIIAVSQLSRKVEDRSDKRPMMSDLRDSGSVEQDADMIFLMYRDSYYNKESQDNSLELILAKHRNGPTGTIELQVDLATQHISE